MKLSLGFKQGESFLRYIIFAFVLLTSFSVNNFAQANSFVGDWEVTLIKQKTKEYPHWLEIKYPVSFSIREGNGKFVGNYTDQYDFSDQFSILAIQQNEIVFVVGGAGKKEEHNLMPIHRAILKKDGTLRGFVFRDTKLFEWVGKRKANK